MHFPHSRACVRPPPLPSRAQASPPPSQPPKPPPPPRHRPRPPSRPPTRACADRTPKGFRPLNLLPTCHVCSSDIVKVEVDENSLAGFPVLKKTVYLFLYIGLDVGRLIFFFSLCIFSQVRNIPERIILISTTGLR